MPFLSAADLTSPSTFEQVITEPSPGLTAKVLDAAATLRLERRRIFTKAKDMDSSGDRFITSLRRWRLTATRAGFHSIAV